MGYIKTYIFNHLYSQYLVLLTMVPRNITILKIAHNFVTHPALSANKDMASMGVVEVDDAGGSASVSQAEPNQATPVPAHLVAGGVVVCIAGDPEKKSQLLTSRLTAAVTRMLLVSNKSTCRYTKKT